MNRKIKVGAVNYLNAKPLIYGIENSEVCQQIELITDYPANIAKELIAGNIDVGLVPVAVMPFIKNAQIISNYGITADGSVASVCIFSNCPIEEIKELYLDYQSRTSVRLSQILLQHHFKKEVKFMDAPTDFTQHIKGNTAAVIIGDRALEQLPNFPYVYDLARLWKDFTGLPFVFAAWIANKTLPKEFTTLFNQANALGTMAIDTIVPTIDFPVYDLKKYYTEDIKYFITEDAHKGLNLFLSYLKENN